MFMHFPYILIAASLLPVDLGEAGELVPLLGELMPAFGPRCEAASEWTAALPL